MQASPSYLTTITSLSGHTASISSRVINRHSLTLCGEAPNAIMGFAVDFSANALNCSAISTLEQHPSHSTRHWMWKMMQNADGYRQMPEEGLCYQRPPFPQKHISRAEHPQYSISCLHPRRDIWKPHQSCWQILHHLYILLLDSKVINSKDKIQEYNSHLFRYYLISLLTYFVNNLDYMS